MSDDIAAIKQALATYCHRADRGTATEVAALFAEDAILSPHYDGEYEVYGRDCVHGWYAFYRQTTGAGVRNLKHLIHSMMIDVDGNVASSVCYFTANFVSKHDNTAYQAQGTYHDTLVRSGQQWLFQTRRIEAEFITSIGVAIDRMEPMGFPANAD